MDNVNNQAIRLGAMVGIAFIMLLALIGTAIALSAAPEKLTLPSTTLFSGIGILSIAILTAPFFISGYLSSKMGKVQSFFDSLIHSVASWAILTIFLAALMFSAMIGDGIRRSVDNLQPPQIVTDIAVFKAKAVTTIEPGSDKEKKASPKAKKVNTLFLFAWWVAVLSQILGLGTAILGGFIAKKRR